MNLDVRIDMNIVRHFWNSLIKPFLNPKRLNMNINIQNAMSRNIG